MSSPAIAVSDLRKTYTEGLVFRKRQEALKGISFEVKRGEIFGLLGGNGAGKTTFIKILLGIIRRTSGNAQILDFPAGDSRATAEDWLPAGKSPRPAASDRLHGTWSTTAISAASPTASFANAAARCWKKSASRLRAKDPVRTYSKGMLQRLGLAQAMLHDPDLFIFDEPTDGLDPLARSQVRGFLTDLKRDGKTIFLNSHILQEVQLVCDRVAILDKGVLKRVGSVQELTATHQAAPATTGNPTRQADIQLHLAGTASAIREALGGWETTKWNSLSEVEHQVDIRSADQEYVDQLIDRLRAARISILGINRHQATLEDAYLGIVAEVVN